MSVTIYTGDVLAGLAKIESGTVQTCVTSPPYWGLRFYFPDGVKIRKDLTEEQLSSLLLQLEQLGINPIAE